MAKYATQLNDTIGTGTSLGTVRNAGSNMRRSRIYDLILGTTSAAADAQVRWTVTRLSAAGAGTGTAVTAQSLDPGDSIAATTVTHENFTAEPTTYDAVPLLSIALNQRATFRWVAAPGGEIVIPATASVGVGIRTPVISTGTPDGTATVHFEE